MSDAKDKSIFKRRTTTTESSMSLPAYRAPLDVRLVVENVDDLFIISGDDLAEEDTSNIAYSGMFVWVNSERAYYVYDENQSDGEGLIYPQRDANKNLYANTTDPDPNPNYINGVAVTRHHTKWKKYAVQSLSSETAAEADRLKETRLIQGHAFDGTQSVESGLFYPEELTLTAQENIDYPTNEEKATYLKEKMKTINQSGFYYGSYPDGSGTFGLEVVYMGGGTIIRDDKGNITAINGGRYRRTLTEFTADGDIVVSTTIGETTENTSWEEQISPCSVARVGAVIDKINNVNISRFNNNQIEDGVMLDIVVGKIEEKWVFVHGFMPSGKKYVRDHNGVEFDFDEPTETIYEPYYVRLTNHNGVRKAAIVSLRADRINHGFVRLTDDIADDDNTAERGGVAASPKAVSTVNGYLIEHQQCGEDENQQAIFAKGKASGARFGHVVLSDIETAAELEKDKNAATAATPKGVKTVVDEACATKADLTDIAPDFDPAATYAVGDLVTHNGDLYRCIKPHRDETAFDTYAEMVQEVFGGWDMEHNYADGEFVKGNKSSQQQTPVRKLLHPIVFEEIEVEEFSLTGTYEAGKYIKWANSAIYLTTQSLDILNLVDFFNRYVQVVDEETTETTFSYSNNYNIGKTVKIGDKVYRFQRKYQASTIIQILDQNCTPLRLLGNVDTWFSKANFSIINGDVFNNATDLYQSGRFFKYVGETYTNHSTVEQDSIAQFAGLESAEAGKYFYQEADREHTFTDIQIFSLYRFKETYPLQFNRFFDRVTVGDELNREAAARAAADSDEATARAAADEALQGNIDTEAATRENADLVLGERLTQHADTKATAAVSAHVSLSDSDYQPELDVYEHVAATPKAVSTKANTTTLAAEFDPTATYAVGDLVTRSGNLYRCIDDYADPSVFENNFVQVDTGAAIDIEKAYAVDDFAIISNNLYRCKSAVDLPALLPKMVFNEFGSRYNYAAGDIVEWLGNYYEIQADCTLRDVYNPLFYASGTYRNAQDNPSLASRPLYNPHTTYSMGGAFRVFDEKTNIWRCFDSSKYNYPYHTPYNESVTVAPARLTEWLAAKARQIILVESFGLNTVISGETIVKLDDSTYYHSDDETLNIGNHFEQLTFKEVMAAPAGVIPALNIGGAYTAGDWVADGGKNYQCIIAVDFAALLEMVAVTAFGSRYNYQKGDIVTWLGVHYEIMNNCTLYAPLAGSEFFDYSYMADGRYDYPDLDISRNYTSADDWKRFVLWDEKRNGWHQYLYREYREYYPNVVRNYTPSVITEWLENNHRRLTFDEWNIQSSFDSQTLLMENNVIYRLAAGAEAFSVGDFFLTPEAMTAGGELTTQRGEFIKRAGVIYRSLYNFPASFAQMFELVKVGTMLLAETAERRAAVAAEETARKNAAVTLQNNIDTEAASRRQDDALLDIKIDSHTAKHASDSTFGHVQLLDDISSDFSVLDGSTGFAVTPKAMFDFVQRVKNSIIDYVDNHSSTPYTPPAQTTTYWGNAEPETIANSEYYNGGFHTTIRSIRITDWINEPAQLNEGDKVKLSYYWMPSITQIDNTFAEIDIKGHIYQISTQGLSNLPENYGSITITYQLVSNTLVAIGA